MRQILTDQERTDLLACVNAELWLLAASGEDYEGPLKAEEIFALWDLIQKSTTITLTFPD